MFGLWGSAPRRGGDGRNVLPDGTEVHLALYKFDACPFCARVHRVIDELGVNVEYRDTRADATWRDDLRERTGRTQVPCLLIDDEPLFESAAIASWLRERFGAQG